MSGREDQRCDRLQVVSLADILMVYVSRGAQMPDEATEPAQSTTSEAPSLPREAHILCGWPLLLILVGGAVGGGLGGAAYAINLSIYKSRLPVVAKVFLNLFTGIAAIGIWLAVVVAIQSKMHSN